MTIFAYGTLRQYDNPTAFVRGRLYDLGSFPALILDPKGDLIKGELMEVDNYDLASFDRYEGYNPSTHTGLYLRVPTTTEDGQEVQTYTFSNTSELSELKPMTPIDGIVEWKPNTAECLLCGKHFRKQHMYVVNDGMSRICHTCAIPYLTPAR